MPQHHAEKKTLLVLPGPQRDPGDDIIRLIGEAREGGDEFLAYLLSLALAHARERAMMREYLGAGPAEPRDRGQRTPRR